jgi:hypothetical protein
MDQPLDLFVLKGSVKNRAVAVARRGPDSAIADIDLKHPEIDAFLAFADRVNQVALGGDRPTTLELADIGTRLFDHVFKGDVLRLYNRVPAGPVSIQITTNEPLVHRIPWEYLNPVDRQPVPHRERCVVRVLPLCAPSDPEPQKALKKLRVLLAVADPVDQQGVTWKDVELSVSRAFELQAGNLASLKIVAAATRQSLLQALNAESYDVFHFLGHGIVVEGEGALALIDLATKKSDYLKASELANALCGQGLRLALLSACLTAAGDFADDFGPIALALLKAGIPAVVANQTSIPTKSVAPFVTALYARLLKDGNIDAAVMAGRVALQLELRKGVPEDRAIVEWGIPALYRLPGGAQLFKPRGDAQ